MTNLIGGGTASLAILRRIEKLEKENSIPRPKFWDDIISNPTGKISLTFSGRFSALVTLNSSLSTDYGTYIVQGYGPANYRLHVTSLQNGSGVSYTVDSNEEKVIFSITPNALWNYSILMLQGDLPIIS